MAVTAVQRIAESTDGHAAIAELARELIEAHTDTLELGDGARADERWRAHLAYVHDLCFVGARMLERDRG
jgi:hypothetical protein